MPINLDRLDWTINGSVNKSAVAIFNELEKWCACSGIIDDYDNAYKAIRNHHGFPGLRDSWVPAREYITNATSSNGHHKGLASPTLKLQQVLMKALKDSVKRKQTFSDITGYTYAKTSQGSNLAFGTTNSPRRIVEQVAKQMYENQMAALATVTPHNTKATLSRKKARSTQPLVDYGKMRDATHPFVTYEGEVA